MLMHVDSALENDRMAGIGAGLLGVATWVCLGLDLIPGAHVESAGSLATAAVLFAGAALRRAGAPKRKADADVESTPS